MSSNDWLAMAGMTISLAGTVYLVSETGKLIKQSIQPMKTKTKKKKADWEFNFNL